MYYPQRPEGTRLLFYNIHLPGKNGNPGTPIGVVALLVSEDLEKIARGITVRSLLDEWDPGEGRIRAAGRAIRAYNKYYGSDDSDLKVSVSFKHPHARKAVGLNGFNTSKYAAPAVPTPREYKLLDKRFGDRIRAEHGVHV
jgi:hypothetical protein